MKTVLVCGGAGFIGSNLCSYLVKKGEKVICVDNFCTGNRDNIKDLDSSLFSIIEHDITEPLEIDEDIDEILQASTSEVYGNPLEHPQKETYHGDVNPIGVRSCYDEGKRAAETLFFDFHRTFSTKIKIIRIFNVYGPNMDPFDGRVISNFINQALKGEDITVYGDGRQTRSFSAKTMQVR